MESRRDATLAEPARDLAGASTTDAWSPEAASGSALDVATTIRAAAVKSLDIIHLPELARTVTAIRSRSRSDTLDAINLATMETTDAESSAVAVVTCDRVHRRVMRAAMSYLVEYVRSSARWRR